MLIIHLPWTMFPYACTAEVVLVQMWKNASVTKQSGQRNRRNSDIGIIFKWLEGHDVLVLGYGKITGERKLLLRWCTHFCA
jgi:hypothetical protein